MARKGSGQVQKTDMVDGFTALRAVRDAHAEAAPSTVQSESIVDAEPQPIGTRLGSTAMPSENRIVCYECGYEFRMTGKVARLACSKCHILLDTGDHVVDSVWTEDLKTVGTIRIVEGGAIQGGVIIANDVVLAGGTISGGRVNAVKCLVLEHHNPFSRDFVTARDLRIAEGVSVATETELTYREVELAGRLSASLKAVERLIIRETGCLVGKVQTPSLVVEDGAGLLAEIDVGVVAEGVEAKTA